MKPWSSRFAKALQRRATLSVVRVATLIAVAVAALTGATCAGGASAARSELTITAWPDGADRGVSRTWTLRCDPVGGTLPRAARACAALAALERPFVPVPRVAICTQQYGGPQEALVRGTFRGRRVWTRFRRTNGCEIARWNRHSFLFPIPVGIGGGIDR